MRTLTQEYRATDIITPRKITEGLDGIVDSLAGHMKRRGGILDSLRVEAERIDALAAQWRGVSDARLRERLAEFQQLFRRHPKRAEAHLHEALAAIREAADRRVGLRPFVVQLMGALALQRGYLVEMATGEGKTLVAGLAGVLNGWTKLPCHIVTVNDYLAQRDAQWLHPLYDFCGVSVGFVTSEMNSVERLQGYAQDVTYTTSKEITADFLRDRLRFGPLQNASRRLIRQILAQQPTAVQGAVMRGLHTAIVDEADSVLIDEAVTPLIISSAEGNAEWKEAYRLAQQLAAVLERDVDYTVNLRYREIELRDGAYDKIKARCEGLAGLWQSPARRMELVQQALAARELFHEGKQYVKQDGKIVIVDEFTGRMMPMRKWRHGLHQAIEAKEGLEITAPGETLARLSFQRFFRLFRKLSGMTGTARDAAAEFWHIYRLPVIVIPTNKPCVRTELPDRVFPSQDSKWDAVVEEIQRLHAQGRPVLVGTRSIAASELLAGRLAQLGLPFNLLNATRHRQEAQIVAEAGLRGKITIATNMAGRGTDIKLGDSVASLGGLHVLATERHESRRIDRQLFGRAGRQGDPGSAQAFVSTDDELLRRFALPIVRRHLETAVRHRLPGADAMAAVVFALAQQRAQRLAFRQRCAVLKSDTWLDEALSFGGQAGV